MQFSKALSHFINDRKIHSIQSTQIGESMRMQHSQSIEFDWLQFNASLEYVSEIVIEQFERIWFFANRETSILTRGKWKLTRLLQFLILCFPISSITGATIKFIKCESMNRFSEKDWRDENFHIFNQILCKVQNLLG